MAIHEFAKLLLERRPIPIYGDGSSYRDYTYVSDIVQGLLAALVYDRSSFEVINLGNNQMVSILEMVQDLVKMLANRQRLNTSHGRKEMSDRPRQTSEKHSNC